MTKNTWQRLRRKVQRRVKAEPNWNAMDKVLIMSILDLSIAEVALEQLENDFKPLVIPEVKDGKA